MSNLLNYMRNANRPADVYIQNNSYSDDSSDNSSSGDSGFSLSSIADKAAQIISNPGSLFDGMGTVIAPNYQPRQLSDDASTPDIYESNPDAPRNVISNWIADNTTTIAPNYQPRPLNDSVYSDIPGTPVGDGPVGALEDESVRNARMKASADYMAANWPRLYGGVVGADEGLANVVGGMQSALGGGNDVLNNVDIAEKGMENYRKQWNNAYGDSYVLNPSGLANDIGASVGSTLPIMALSALMPGAAVAGGTRAITQALTRAGLGKVAQSAVGQELIANAVRSPISSLADSLSEYGSVANTLQKNGMSEDEARVAAAPMFFKNMALDTLMIPGELTIAKGMKGITKGFLTPSIEESARSRIGKALARGAVATAGGAATEGYQEGAQNALENQVQGERESGWYNPMTWTDEDWKSARGGAVGGALLGAPGNLASGFRAEKSYQLTDDDKAKAAKIKAAITGEAGKNISNSDYNQYMAMANSGNPNLINIASLALSDKTGGGSAVTAMNDNTVEQDTAAAVNEYDSYVQKSEIADFLNSNTVDQIGQENHDWLVGVIRNGTSEEVNKAYESVIKAQKETAAQNKSATRSRMSANTGNSMVNTVIQAANDSDVDPRLGLAIAARESGGDDVNAIGMPEPHDGVYGIMQAQDETVEDLGLDKQYPDWKTDPYQNAMVGMAILKAKIAGENGDVWAGVRAYNGSGPEAEQYRDMVKNNYDNMGDVGNSSGSYDGNVLDENGNPYYDISEADAPNVEGETQDTINKLQILAHDFYKQFGQRLSITSMKRDGDPNASDHNTGNAFDTASDFLEQNKDAREWLMQRGQELGLTPLDEYEHPSANATGGHVHFSNNGGPISGNATVSNSSSDNDIERMQSQFDSEMNQIQADSNAAMNDIMNDDSMERTNAAIDQETEAARKAAQEDQATLNGENQVTANDVVPDVAKDVLDTSQDIDEVNTLDGMFTNDANGNAKFIDTPENRNYIKENYKKEIGDAVKQAITDNATPTTKAADKTTPQLQTEAPHAQLGRILSTFDRNHPQFKQYMGTFRNGTEEQQAALADQLQQSQAKARNEAKATPVTPATPSPNNQQNVAESSADNVVGTQNKTEKTPQKTVSAVYKEGGNQWRGGLKNGEITTWSVAVGKDGPWTIKFDVNKLHKAFENAKTEAEARAIIHNQVRNEFAKRIDGAIKNAGGESALKEWNMNFKDNPAMNLLYDGAEQAVTNLYEQAAGQTLKNRFDDIRKGVDTNEKGDEDNNRNSERKQVESKDAESAVSEEGTQSDVQEEVNNESDSNSEDTLTDEEREKLAYYKHLNDRINKTRDDFMSGKIQYKEAEKKLDELKEEIHDAYIAKKVDMNDDEYHQIHFDLIDAVDEVSSAAAREYIREKHAQKEKDKNATKDAESNNVEEQEKTEGDAKKQVEDTLNDQSIESELAAEEARFGSVADAEEAVMAAFGIKKHNKPKNIPSKNGFFDSPSTSNKTTKETVKQNKNINHRETPETPKKATTPKDNETINKTFHLLDDSDAALEAEKKAILAELSKISSNPMFNPTLMYHMVKLGAIHVQRGLNTFASWAKAMKETMPQGEPFLRSVWTSLQSMPKNASLDEKRFTAAVKYVGSMYDYGMTDKVLLRREFIGTLGARNARYFDAVYNAVINYPSVKELKGATNNVNSSTDKLASRSGEGASENGLGQGSVQGRGPVRSSGRDSSPAGKGPEERRNGDISVSDGRTPVGRKTGNSTVQTEKSTDRRAGSPELSGSVRDSLDRVPDDESKRNDESVRAVEKRPKYEDPIEKVQKEQHDSTIESIKKALPMLLPEQAEDVKIAETRFANHNGMMFTNGTGTGKTYTGLGIIKRFVDAGKNNILIIAPSDGILKQWEKAAKNDFGIKLTRLGNKKDAGHGPVTTTYANAGDNHVLVNREFDLVITDESQKLMGGANAIPTQALNLMRAITGHEDGFQRYRYDKHIDISEPLSTLNEKIKDIHGKIDKLDKEQSEARRKGKVPDNRIDNEKQMLESDARQLQDQAKTLRDKLKTFETEDKEKFAKRNQSKVVFLSATPFEHVANLDYANGYLFNYSDYGPMEEQGYNHANGKETFYMENFGYQMRYNRLERPGSEVDTDLMERQFNHKLVESGAIHGRMLSSEYDYDRGFIKIDAGVGKTIDDAFEWLRKNPEYRDLSDFLNNQFKGFKKLYLLEAIKAKQAVPLIKEYLKSGKKVVVFHNYNKGGADNPFVMSPELRSQLERTADYEWAGKVLEQYDKFSNERPDLMRLDLNGLESPINALTKAFGDSLVLYNGTLSKKQREANKKSFNDDNSKAKVILVQSDAGQAGVSLHDTTGNHQRALINLGLPTKPSEAIQQEGRIYRVGNKSNAIFRYLNTGTYMEQTAFATKLAERAATVENLALGDMARELKAAYVEAFEESQEGDEWRKYLPGSATEGTGGKAIDYKNQHETTDFDRAKGVYFSKQKRTASTKAREGVDYFATPEPLGLKMVEWLNSKPGDSLLEPSAGDGAIARWMPNDTYNTVVEPSRDLTPKLMRNVSNAKVVENYFENLDLHNKFDGIVMNPPFGKGGKTAIEHLAKAYRHLKDGGRVIAIVPDGPSCQKHFDKWMYGDQEAKRKEDRGVPDAVIMAEIKLPSVTFERAGTKVGTKIYVIDKYVDEGIREVANAEARGQIELTANNINDLFDTLENRTMPERIDSMSEDSQYSAHKAGEAIIQSKEELKAGIKEAFPTAKDIKEDGDRITFTMPNGSHIVVDVKNQIVLTADELSKAKKDHSINENDNVVVEGFAKTYGKDAYIALSQGGREGTAFHEAYHVAEQVVLTNKEKAAITQSIPNAEERANKYAEWVEARKHGRGTAWGKLFQKIKDFAAKMKIIFTRTENVHDVFRKIEFGGVWERQENSDGNQPRSYSMYAKRKLKEDMQSFAKKIDDFMNHKLSYDEYVRVMDTPLVLNLIGEKMLPVYISHRVLDKVLHWKHGLEISPEVLKEIPRRIADPMFILKAVDNKGVEDISSKIVVIDLKDNDGATIMIPFVMEQKTRDGNKIVGNIIKSVYGKTIGKGNNHPNNTWYINRLMRGDCIYINKKRTDHWLTGINTSARTPNGPLVVDSFNLSNIIADETDLGKLKKEDPIHYSIRQQEQKISNEAKKRFMSHIEISQKQESENDIGVHRTLLQSPSRIAEKKKYFKPFFKMADDAMNHLTKLRADYQRHLDSALDLSKKDKATLQELLWSGDMEGKEYTREELHKQGYNEKVIDSYWAIRNLFRKAYNQLNETRKQTKTKTGHFAGHKLDELRHNKFVEILRETKQDDGSTLVSYKEHGNWQSHYLVNENELKSLENDDNIQILEKVPTKEGPMDGKKHWKVITREGVPDIHNRKGYIPHFFHEYMVRFVDSHGKSTVVSSGRTIREATKNAIKWQAENEEMLKKNNEGDWKITIAHKVFDFGEVGLDESQYATTVGDKDFYRMAKKIADKHSLTLYEAKEMLDGMVKKKGRHRFFGNFMQRTGADGYEQEIEWVLRHYFNSTSRYVAMESKFKPQAISLFERLFGRFDNEYHGLPNYIKEYINDINGNPSTLEKQLNDLLNATPAIGKWVNARFGDRAAVSLANSITNKISIAKLGFLNVSSAMLNILQIANAAAYTGNISTLWKALLKGAHRKYSLHDLKILRQTNVLNDIGLDSGAGYGKFSAGKWANRGMILFKESEGIVRRGVTLAAYEAARKRSMSHEEAIRYAKDVNRKSNFDYGVHDAPGIFRRGSIASQILLQFKKYPIKQLEAMKDFLPFFGKETTKKQKTIFWGTYFAMAGLFQIPFANILGLLIMGIAGDDPEKEAKKSLIELAEKYPSLKPIAKIGMYGIGAFANIDITSRVGIGDAVPDDLKSLFGPAASTLFNVAKSAYDGDSWIKQVRNISPGLGNLLMATQGESVGKRGRINQEYTTPYQRLLRGMGFQSTDESDSYLIQSILFSENKKASSKKQQLIDEYIANPTGENARKLKDAGIKPSTVKAEQKKKKLDTKGRTESSMNKNDRKQYQYLLEW